MTISETPSKASSQEAPSAVPVTVLGLGNMGRALAGAFLSAGYATTLWNRTPGRGDDLVARGAVHAPSAADAVRASALTVVSLVDYDAAEAVLAPLAEAGAFEGGRVLVNLTSDTPERSRSAAEWAAEHGIAYLDGSVMVPTTVVGGPEALIFYSGDREAFERYEGTLRALGARATFLDEDPGLAAVYDLAMLDFFYTAMSGLIHAFALAGADGVKAAALAPHLDTISAILPPLAGAMAAHVDAGEYPGDLGNLAMETAGIDHILHMSRSRGLDVTVLEAVRAIAGRALEKGHGGDDWSRTVEEIRP
ncbi:NAD(P)-dependent oxidoreductase [Streptomyces sp. TLI_146]|uniref:NAD(P)-dependent oxidoreductase n=1 Tax=Streptomyces sp. TLI_146 TaxID=1938858 RepID=UPI000C7121AA|nr:NAD(P)-binding domain-containing protein [Streptomyces sp. TLI_146]PKV87982.1 3-hydroxyisobutyrate dehydrogenase-like beta-hydroxyacid dehydrogenase [Streptomyces sp. TLI_146]